MTGLASVLGPFGREASQIATLSWIIFIGAAAIMVLVGGALWLAISGQDGLRARLATPRAVIALGIAFPVVTLTVLLLYSLILMRSGPAQSGAKPEIEVAGEQYWWRIGYAGMFGTANELRIPVGQQTALRLISRDVIHSFWVPSLAGKVDMLPGRDTTITLTPERPGIFRGVCAEFCGTGHAYMAFSVVAMPQTEYDAWRIHQARDAETPRSPTAQQGRDMFRQAGCGACHTVRGTEAAGLVGPDLTHVGSRLSIGAGVLPMTEENIASFIADSARHKPDSQMPPFRVLGDGERRAIAAYLNGLK
jgi:cytochrome c oxidase subunit II